MTEETAVLQSSLGPSLRRWRVLNRVKQEALAADLGVSQSRISRWESGALEPDEADRRKITRLLRARPETASDRALMELVSCASAPVHLVCDLTHRLLAASPTRTRLWHVPVAELMDKPLWRFASQSIREVEHELEDKGWFEPLGPDIVYQTERADFAELTIPQSRIRISRLALSDGRYARLVRDDTVTAE